MRAKHDWSVIEAMVAEGRKWRDIAAAIGNGATAQSLINEMGRRRKLGRTDLRSKRGRHDWRAIEREITDGSTVGEITKRHNISAKSLSISLCARRKAGLTTAHFKTLRGPSNNGDEGRAQAHSASLSK